MSIKNVFIFGVGAAGSNVFLNLLYMYPDLNFTIIDFDKVEDRNISQGTQPYMKADLNRPKTQSIQRLAMMYKNKKIDIVNKKMESKSDIKNLIQNPSESLIVDCFDNAQGRNLFVELGKKFHILHIGFSEHLNGEAIWNELYEPMKESKSDALIDVCEMAVARPFIQSLTGMASIVISNFIEKDKKINMYFDSGLTLRRFD
jgi:molybdopterin/thiamine biosynthesis adenylyltransferase